MIIIWLILFAIICAISYYLTQKSLRFYLEEPPFNIPYGVFLVQSPSLFNLDFLNDLYSRTQNMELIFSFERLFKGNMTALVIYGPSDLLKNFPYLNLLELEDYSQKQDLTKITSWELRPRRSLKKIQKQDLAPKFLKGLHLKKDNQVYFQVVCQFLGKAQKKLNFQVHMRVAICAKDSAERTKLAKDLDLKINQEGHYTRNSISKTSSQIFHGFTKRNITPKEVVSFRIEAQELLNLLNQ